MSSRVTWGGPGAFREGAESFCTITAANLGQVLDSGLISGPGDEPTVEIALDLTDAPPPVVAHRYERRQLLGAGGMGEVWRVFDQTLRRTVALKLIRSRLLGEQLLVRFREEAQVSAQLQHPGIIPVHDFGVLDDGRVWFTMKEVVGRTLEELLQEVHRAWRMGLDRTASGFTFRRMLESFLRVCETMAYAHSRGVVHRDLKPANIMLGAYGEVLVLDWGLAKLVDGVERTIATVDLGETSGNRTTQVGAITGTPAYMSPEQARGESATAGAAADVYALGATLYDLLCERPPRLASTPRKLVMQVALGTPFPPPSAVADGPAIDEELERICLKALEQHVADRYADAGEMSADLALWLDGARKRERAMAIVAEAEACMTRANEGEVRSRQLAVDAAAALAGVAINAPVPEKVGGWALEEEAQAQAEAARTARTEGVQLLRAALSHDPDLVEAHDQLADHFHRVHRHLEAEGLDGDATQVAADLRLHDRSGRYAAYLAGTGALTLHTDVPAEARLHRFALRERRLVPVYQRSLGTTPLERLPLDMGSYLITLHGDGLEVVRYPVSIGREQHWDGVPPGGSAPLPVRMPRRGSLARGEVYVPAGWYWFGDRATTGDSLPRELRWTDAFVIGRTPVTLGEYVAYLNALVAAGDEAAVAKAVPLLSDSDEPFLGRGDDGRFTGIRDSGQAKGYWDVLGDDPELPILLVDYDQAQAYASWAGGRLPDEGQWQKAHRGVDGRSYPWGDAFDPTWCQMADSGPNIVPVEVGRHPENISPFGVADGAGNVMEWATLVDGSPGQLGGAGGNGMRPCRLSRRVRFPAFFRAAYSGFRLLRSFSSGN